MGFTYPLSVTFNTREEHIRHVKENKTFYMEILQQHTPIKQVRGEETEMEKERKKIVDDEMAKKVQRLEHENSKLEDANKTLEKQKTNLREDNIKHIEEKKNLTEKLEKGQKQVDDANKLVAKKKKYDAVEPTAKGKTFEEMIIFKLKTINRNHNLGFKIDDKSKKKACDIRLEYRGQGTIGIEAKDKQRIENNDITKFDRDRLQNNFDGAVFWSKTSKIHGVDDKGEDDYFFEISPNDKTLFLRGDDYDRSAYIIFTYAKFVFLLKNQKTSSQETHDMISKMFEMVSTQYKQFCKLKKEVQNLDVMFKNNLEMIDHLCEENRLKDLKMNFKLDGKKLVVVPWKDVKSSNSNVYKNEELELLKNKSKDFFGNKRPNTNEEELSSPKKGKSDVAIANEKAGNAPRVQPHPIKISFSDDDEDEDENR